MELSITKDNRKLGKDATRLKTISSDRYMEENPYVNTLGGFDRRALNTTRESNIYEDIRQVNFDASDVKIDTRGYFTRCKQYINCIVLSLIGVLFAAVMAKAVVIALPEGNGIHGGWSVWGPWSQCSATCDFGTIHRERNCSNPIPENGGLACFGNAYELQLCNQMICPVIDGGWSLWGSWGQCSVTCDYGMTSRERTCSNPVPTRGGLFCRGSTTDFRLCKQVLCPAIDGGWSDWSAWGTCSATCGTGLQRRNRTCSNQTPEPRGRPCSGDVSDQQLCNIKACDGTGIGFSVYNPQIATPVKFLSALYNYNNVYNTTTGEFVCTKRGLYYFQTTLIRNTAGNTAILGSYCYLYKNNYSIYYFYIYSSIIYPQASGSAIFDLQPGDRIYISGCNNIATFHGYSTFSGFLINTE